MFKNREQAGQVLAQRLEAYAGANTIICALPRGGLPVAASISKILDAPVELILVRKIGAPQQPELAIGAVVDGASPTIILHDDIIQRLDVTRDYVEKAKRAALEEIERRRILYLKDRAPLPLAGKTVVIVDDGLATGATMEAAANAVRRTNPKSLIIAIPVAPADTLDHLNTIANKVICLETPTPFWSVGGHYHDFQQLSDEDVSSILEALNKPLAAE